jgi:hypothetical protein
MKKGHNFQKTNFRKPAFFEMVAVYDIQHVVPSLKRLTFIVFEKMDL